MIVRFHHAVKRRIYRRTRSSSDLLHLIPPEVVDDRLYQWLEYLARHAPVESILEIGSSAGQGSTRALVNGALQNPKRPRLYCLEVSAIRFDQLRSHYAQTDNVIVYPLSSVARDELPSKLEVSAHYYGNRRMQRAARWKDVERWYRQDFDAIGSSVSGIEYVRAQHRIDRFGIVFIDGSEFTGKADLEHVYGAAFIVLDDIGTFKNADNYRRLEADPSYNCVAYDPALRNGFAIFARTDAPGVGSPENQDTLDSRRKRR
jgi:hypothetical protein